MDGKGMFNTKEIVYEKVKACIEDEQCYLDAAMTLSKLSRIVGTNTTYLSRIVNQRYGCAFRDLLNSYRVERAKKVIKETGVSSFEVGTQCGFNSRSSYYDVFQKLVGMSPRQYSILQKEKQIDEK